METCDKIFGTAMVIALVFLSATVLNAIVNAEYETTHYTRTITMKWIEERLLNIDYYFEFDNTTYFKIDLEFDNPAYIYHKYEIGDTFEYNITRQVN